MSFVPARWQHSWWSLRPFMGASYATSNGRIRPGGRLRLDHLPATAPPAFFRCRQTAAFLARQKSRLPPSSAALRAWRLRADRSPGQGPPSRLRLARPDNRRRPSAEIGSPSPRIKLRSTRRASAADKVDCCRCGKAYASHPSSWWRKLIGEASSTEAERNPDGRSLENSASHRRRRCTSDEGQEQPFEIGAYAGITFQR
jgi:hypothetical protein